MPKLDEKVKNLSKKLCRSLKKKLPVFRSRKGKSKPGKGLKVAKTATLQRNVKQCELDQIFVEKSLGDYYSTGDCYSTYPSNKVNIVYKQLPWTILHNSSDSKLKHKRSCYLVTTMPTKRLSSFSDTCTILFDKYSKECYDSKYSKFIPVKDNMGELYPKSNVDQRSMMNWLDIQAFYNNFQYEKSVTNSVVESKSDTAINELVNKNSGAHPGSATPKVLGGEEVTKNKRFSDNVNYLSVLTTKPSDRNMSPIELYIKMSGKNGSHLRLCHIKTEMVVPCLQSFFCPHGDNMVMWTQDLDSHMSYIKENNSVDIFENNISSSVDMDKVGAILYLSELPAQLIRHKDICVLDTIAKTLGLLRSELLVLPIQTLESQHV